jgi:hypothetical protein
MKKGAHFIKQYLARIGSKGGKARASPHDKTTLIKWGKLGCRPRKKGRK